MSGGYPDGEKPTAGDEKPMNMEYWLKTYFDAKGKPPADARHLCSFASHRGGALKFREVSAFLAKGTSAGVVTLINPAGEKLEIDVSQDIATVRDLKHHIAEIKGVAWWQIKLLREAEPLGDTQAVLTGMITVVLIQGFHEEECMNQLQKIIPESQNIHNGSLDLGYLHIRRSILAMTASEKHMVLAGLGACHSAKKIGLGYMECVTSDDLMMLRLPASLQEFHMSNSKVDSAGAAEIVKALPKGILLISLQDNDLGDAGGTIVAEALPAFSQLKVLNIWDNGFSKSTRQLLRAKAPKKCRVFCALSMEANFE